VIAADRRRNLVFVPTGGERVWYFRTVHHDLWDYDVASPPILLMFTALTAFLSRRRRRIAARLVLRQGLMLSAAGIALGSLRTQRCNAIDVQRTIRSASMRYSESWIDGVDSGSNGNARELFARPAHH
jgi:hypothetical protein